MHGQIRIGLPKLHGWFHIGLPQIFHLPSLDFHSRGISVYFSYYERKALKCPIQNIMLDIPEDAFHLKLLNNSFHVHESKVFYV